MAYNPNNPNGQATSANSAPVVLASDQSTLNVAVTSSVEVEVKNDTGNPIPVSGTVTANTGLTQPLTDTQLRASAVPVSASSLPLPTGAATSANQTSTNTKLDTLHSDLTAALPAGTNIIGKVGFDTANNLIQFDKINYTQSSGNNTSAQLAASATFTGSIESGLSHPNLIISLRCDQPVTMTIKQYSDAGGTIAYPDIVYTRTANQGYNDTITLAGSYFRVTVQNTGASTTTTLFLETWVGILPVAQNSTNLGNSPSAINEVSGTAITLGQKVAASSFPVTLSNENVQDLYYTGQAAQTALVNNIIPSTAGTAATDANGYRSGSVQLICPTGTYTTGQIIFEGSNDNTNFQTMPVTSMAANITYTAAITLASNTSVIYMFPINYRYIRVRISTAISGASASVQAFTKLSQTSYMPTQLNIFQSTAASAQVQATVQSAIASAAAADAKANPTGIGFLTFGSNYNGSTWDRPYNNTEVTLLASAARTTTQTSADIVCYNAKKLIVVLDMTVVGTGSVTVSIDGKDTASGKYYNILTGAAITTNSTNRYRIGETLAAVANSVAQDYLPRVIRIVVTANNANSATYSVGYNLGV